MKICVAGSMQLSEKLVYLVQELQKLGFQAVTSEYAESMIGKTDDEKETMKLHQKYDLNAMHKFFYQVKDADALLVANYDKGDKKNYIGANTFLEMGLAYSLHQKIFLINDIPENPFYDTEIKAMQPIVLHGDLSKVKEIMEHA